MSAAINKARETVDQFIAALNNPTEAQESFSVKLPVTDGDWVEHMWLSDVRYAGRPVHRPDRQGRLTARREDVRPD